MKERQVDLSDYLTVIWRWKWLVAAGTVACLLATAVVTSFSPKVYRIEMVLDAGDVSGTQTQAIERLVARLASPVSQATGPGGSPVVLKAEYRPPFLITIHAETQAPNETARVMRDVAAALLADLNRVARRQQEEIEAKVAGMRGRIGALQVDSHAQLGDIRSECEAQLRVSRTQLDLFTTQLRSLRQERALLEQRAAGLRRTLQDMSAVRAETLRQPDRPGATALLAELARGIATAESDLLQVEREATAEIPARLVRVERQERLYAERVAALEAVQRALQAVRTADGTGLGHVRDAVSQASLTGGLDGASVMAMIRRIEVELPDQIRGTTREADALLREASAARAPRLAVPPSEPGLVVRPRWKINLAVSAVVGLVASIVLAFLVEHVGGAAGRRALEGRGSGRGAEARPAVGRDSE